MTALPQAAAPGGPAKIPIPAAPLPFDVLSKHEVQVDARHPRRSRRGEAEPVRRECDSAVERVVEYLVAADQVPRGRAVFVCEQDAAYVVLDDVSYDRRIRDGLQVYGLSAVVGIGDAQLVKRPERVVVTDDVVRNRYVRRVDHEDALEAGILDRKAAHRGAGRGRPRDNNAVVVATRVDGRARPDQLEPHGDSDGLTVRTGRNRDGVARTGHVDRMLDRPTGRRDALATVAPCRRDMASHRRRRSRPRGHDTGERSDYAHETDSPHSSLLRDRVPPKLLRLPVPLQGPNTTDTGSSLTHFEQIIDCKTSRTLAGVAEVASGLRG